MSVCNTETIGLEKQAGITCYEPLIVVQFDGLKTLLTSAFVEQCISIDDNCLFLEDPEFCLDGSRATPDTYTYDCIDGADPFCLDEDENLDELKVDRCIVPCIDLRASTSNVTQKLNPERGASSSISSFKLRIVDEDCWASGLISPGQTLDCVLNKDVDIFLAFNDRTQVFPDDYKRIFRGFICDVCAGHGFVEIKVCHPDQKKRQTLFNKVETRLRDPLTTTGVNACIDAVFLDEEILQPTDCLRQYVRIGDEVIPSLGYNEPAQCFILDRTSDELTGFCGAPEDYDEGEDIQLCYILEGHPIDLALKLMLSCEGLGTNPYDVLPTGLCMDVEDVDIDRHLFIKDTYIPNAKVKIFIKDTVQDMKRFIEEELYLPFSLYAVPREAKSSVNIHSAPFPGASFVTVNADDIKDCNKIKIRRSLFKNFYNQVEYKFDASPCEDEYFGGHIRINQESIEKFERRQVFEICSQGMRTDCGAFEQVRVAGERFLDRYRNGAEFIDGLELMFSKGCDIEIGDPIFVDFTGLDVTNTKTGKRDKGAQFYEVINKAINFKTGKVTVDLVDSNFQDGEGRFGLVSPSVCIESADQIEFAAGSDTVSIDNPYDEIAFCIGDVIQFRDDECNILSKGTVTVSNDSSFTVESLDGFSNTAISSEIIAGNKVLLEYCDYCDVQQCQKDLYAFATDDENEFPSDGGDPYIAF